MKFLKKSKYFPIIAVVIALVVWLSQNTELFSEQKKPVVETGDDCAVHFVDVGQGDCTLVLCGGKSLLIDAGENGYESTVINYIRNCGIEKLDYVVATHQHSDHIGSLAEVFEEIPVDNLIMPRLSKEQTPTNSTYKHFVKAVSESGAKVTAAAPGLSFELGTASFEILGPVNQNNDNLNSMSAVTKITHGENSFIVCGDAEFDEEEDIIATGADLDCKVLRVGHHGSYTSSGNKWLNAVTPEVCVISCGEGNDYGHPHDKALNRIMKHTGQIYRTDICGSIIMTSDSVNLAIEYENEVE